MKIQSYPSPFGEMFIGTQREAIVRIWFGEEDVEEMEETPLHQKAALQLEEYFSGKRSRFSLPLAPKGTEFQQRVWKKLMEIPYGEVESYKELAQRVGTPKGYRAVGNANGKNPIPIVIPCHRVIATGGGLGGFAYGLSMKSTLLELEQKKTL